MAPVQLKENFELESTIESIYTGGKVCISHDLTKIFTTLSEDIQVTDYVSGKKIALLKGESDVITCLSVRPNGKHLVSSSRSLLISVWDLETYTLVRSFKAHEAPVITMAFDETSTLIATGSADSSIKVWDVDGGFCTHNFRGHGGVISALTFFKPPKSITGSESSNNIWLASGANDCTVRIWDLSSGNCRATLSSHNSVIRGLDFSRDGLHLLSGSRDQVVNLWSCKKFTLVKSLPVYESIESCGFVDKEVLDSIAPGKKLEMPFFTGGEQGKIKLWDMGTEKLIYQQTPSSPKPHPFTDLIHLPEHHLLVTVADDHNIVSYSLKDNLRQVRQIIGYTEEVVDLKFVGTGSSTPKHLAVASNSEQIRLYNVETLDCSIIEGHADTTICLDSRLSDGLMVSGSKDHTARLWKVESESDQLSVSCVAICSGHTEAVGALAISHKLDHRTLLVTGSQDRTIKMWDLTPALDASQANGTPYSPTSIYTFQAHDKDINAVTFSPSDKYFATGSHDKTAKLWNTEDGSLSGVFKGHKRGIWKLAFSPSEPLLATASGDKTVKLWNVNDFSCVRTFEGHTNSVLGLIFLSAGSQLMSSGSDGLVKLWTIKTNQCVATLDNHTEKVWALTARQDEAVVASGGADATISFWKDVTQEELERKFAETEERILKEQELSNYMRSKDFVSAFRLCLALDHPSKILKLLEQLIEDRSEGNESVTGSLKIDSAMASLDMAQVQQMLGYIKDWNTNSRHAHLAQNLLFLILQHYDASELNAIPGIKEKLTALIPYTQRHYNKLDQLIIQSFLIDYTLQAMDQN